MYSLISNHEAEIKNYLDSHSFVTKYEISRLAPKKDGEADKYNVSENAVLVYAELSAEAGSFIRMEVLLPEECTLDFVGLGNGSMASIVRHSYLAIASDKHFIAMNCDLGTSRGEESGINNPAVWKDFGYRATHIATEIGKGIATAAYGKSPVHSVFCGGSTGGQQALSEAQLYPADYDAIIAVAPANNRMGLHAYFLWNFLQLHDGSSVPMFSDEECEAIRREFVALAKKDGDGEAGDNFISISYAAPDTVARYVDTVCDKLNLTDKQENALMAVYGGPVTKDGKRMYCGMPFGTELRGSGLAALSKIYTPSQTFYPFLWALGKDFDITKFNFDTDYEKAYKILAPHVNVNDADLSEFFSHGGKLIIISASADPCVPAAETYFYASEIAKTVGKDIADEHLRYYIAPSLDHRFAGVPEFLTGYVITEDGRTLLDLIVDVAHGEALPDKLITEAKGDGDEEIIRRVISPLPLDGDIKIPAPTTDRSFR